MESRTLWESRWGLFFNNSTFYRPDFADGAPVENTPLGVVWVLAGVAVALVGRRWR